MGVVERMLAVVVALWPAFGLATAAEPEGADGRERPDWPFRPVVRPDPPPAAADPWVRDAADGFVLAALRERRLEPSGEADRRTLVRRLSFDLLGLPPAPEAIEEFVADPSPDAWERLVDRLLASPAHGERWGRHWLDIVRFCESHGYEYDHLRENAWRYRDYVIDAFNSDKPYVEFVREQIAGDVTEPVTRDGIVATGLLVSGPWDQAGSLQANVTQRRGAREEELEGLVATVSQTFLGLTVNCARCHDHKFDPLTQSDYYAVRAVFDGVWHGDHVLPGDGAAREKAEAPAESTYAGERKQPDPAHRLRRGNVLAPAEIVAPAGLEAISEPARDLGLAADAPEAERRRRFAAWLTDPRHPLLGRVIVNRLWQHHFGQGIVETPNDFGSAGAGPSHPELLDWLASELHACGSRLKDIHRAILRSATYRQSSAWREAAHAVDAEARFLWRFPPRRLEAETVRDSMLAASGRLHAAMGGPSFRPFTVSKFGSTFYTLLEEEGPALERRTVYRMNVNSGRSPFLDVLDCPDPSVQTPRRRATTTPLQALALMNSAFVARQADALADRVLREAGGDIPGAVDRAFVLAFGRDPARDERELAAGHAREHGVSSLAWILLNASEFLHVR